MKKVATEFNQAFAVRDVARVKSLLSDNYVLHFTDREMTGSLLDSPIAPRGQWIVDAFNDLSNGPLEWGMIDARVVGDVGVVVSHYKWSGTFRSKGFQRDGYLTDVWVRRGGRWQLLLSSTTLIDPR